MDSESPAPLAFGVVPSTVYPFHSGDITFIAVGGTPYNASNGYKVGHAGLDRLLTNPELSASDSESE